MLITIFYDMDKDFQSFDSNILDKYYAGSGIGRHAFSRKILGRSGFGVKGNETGYNNTCM